MRCFVFVKVKYVRNTVLVYLSFKMLKGTITLRILMNSGMVYKKDILWTSGK